MFSNTFPILIFWESVYKENKPFKNNYIVLSFCFLFLLKKTVSQVIKTINTGVSKALRSQNKGVQSVETHDESLQDFHNSSHWYRKESRDFRLPATSTPPRENNITAFH